MYGVIAFESRRIFFLIDGVFPVLRFRKLYGEFGMDALCTLYPINVSDLRTPGLEKSCGLYKPLLEFYALMHYRAR